MQSQFAYSVTAGTKLPKGKGLGEKLWIIWLYTRSTHHFSASGKSESCLGTINQVAPFGFGHTGIPTLTSFTLLIYSFEVFKCLHLPVILYGFVPHPKRGFCGGPLLLPSPYRPEPLLGPFIPGHTEETQAGIWGKRTGKSSLTLSWPVTSVINRGGQVEAGEWREGSAEDGRVAVITGSMSSSFVARGETGIEGQVSPHTP